MLTRGAYCPGRECRCDARAGPPPAAVYAVTMANVEIIEAVEVTPELVEAFDRLVPQLSSSNAAPTETELGAIVGSAASILLLAVDRDADDRILGSLTLAWFRIPTGVRAWIEDVVVDGEARGRGVGELLNRAALDRARGLGARTVDLTSRPSREAANRLYRRIGFEPRDTNVYRFDL
jgi:ribosomal protein S18 acetylase RimI-like enzyme